jgi:tetratricopeptide (TPR) repeat protein
VSKAQLIRKKALDLVRDQDWPNAIKEYERLVELDQSNPNLHNELADLYLKTNQKNEAYDAFIARVDEYVARRPVQQRRRGVQEVLRVLPARNEALVKLGFIRSRQGLAKEAESYYEQFLDKAAGNALLRTRSRSWPSPSSTKWSSLPPYWKNRADVVAYMLKEDAGDGL